MSQALATKELTVNGPILENGVLVGGLTFFMIFMSQIFLISQVKYTWEAFWYCFADLLQADLDKVKEYWNSHRIRKSRHGSTSGVPDMMYFLPEEFGYHECIHPVSVDKITEIKNRLEELEGEDEEDTVFEEYFQYVMELNNLNHPTSIEEGGVFFQRLTQFACGN